VRNLPPFPQALIAGGLSALLTSVLIWVFTITGLFAVAAIPVAAPADPGSWFAWRTLWGAVFGVFFLIPLLADVRESVRGLLVALVPIAKLLLWDYPQGPEGWFGLNLGALLPITAVVLWLIWGALAGWMLDRWGFGGVPAEEELPPE